MTKKKRYKRYSPEFKREALMRASEEGVTGSIEGDPPIRLPGKLHDGKQVEPTSGIPGNVHVLESTIKRLGLTRE